MVVFSDLILLVFKDVQPNIQFFMAFLLSSSSPLLALAPINSVVIKLIGERGPMLGHVRLLLPIYTSYTGGTVRKVHKILAQL